MTAPFRLKQFTIQQDEVAMKVGTDGILLGAWVNVDGAKRVLDVGTGSGLIALMLAQRTSDHADKPDSCFVAVDAVDIDPAACSQATENVDNSPWPERVSIIHSSIQQFSCACSRSYDLIVSNPPYFENSLPALDQARSRARHTTHLPFDDLCQSANKLLAHGGKFCLISPADQFDARLQIAQRWRLECQRVCWVKPTPFKAPKRVIIEFGRRTGPWEETELTVEVERHVYTDEFKVLAQDFYLSL